MSAPQPPVGGAVDDAWRPIETAPRDVAILVCYAVGTKGKQKVEAVLADDNDYGWRADKGERMPGLSVPTHWQPMPAPYSAALAAPPAPQPPVAGAVAWRSAYGKVLSNIDVRYDGIDTTGWTPLYTHPAPQDAKVGALVEAANRMMEFSDSEYVPNVAFARLTQALAAMAGEIR